MFSGRRKRLGYLAAALATLLVVAVWVPGCDWFDDDDAAAVQSRFVVTTDTDGDTLTIFRIQDNGALTYVDNVDLAVDSGPSMIALHPSGRYAYVMNTFGSNIQGGEYDSSTALGDELAGSPFFPADASCPINCAITPNGKYIYVADQCRYGILAMAIADNGALTDLPVPTYDAEDTHGIAMHPNGTFLFDGSENPTGDIRTWSIADNGALTETADSPYDGSGAMVWLAVHPNGKFLYAASIFDGIDGVSIADNGALTQLPGFPVEGGEGTREPKGLAITRSGKFLYSANFSDASVGAFAIADNGALTAVSGQPFESGFRPKNVSVTRDGRFLYVANYGDDSVEAFSIDSSTGALTSIATYPTAGAGPKYLTTLP